MAAERFPDTIGGLHERFVAHERADERQFHSINGKLDKILTQATLTNSRVNKVEETARLERALEEQRAEILAHNLDEKQRAEKERNKRRDRLLGGAAAAFIAVLGSSAGSFIWLLSHGH